MEKQLRAIYKPHNCVHCGNRLTPKITDETVFNPDKHSPIYWHDRENWFPHYDVEYGCEKCGHYEHYTHNADGSLKVMSINKVIFDVEHREFAVIKEDKIIPAGKLPRNVEPFSEGFHKYLEKILKKAYQKG